MSGKNFMLFFSTNRRYLPVVCLALIFCLLQNTSAQSGRKKDKPAESQEQTAATVSEPQSKKQTVRVFSLKVTGEIQYDSGWEKSNYLGSALDECVNSLQGRPGEPLKVEKVNKMRLNDAKELAKKETEAHVLWMGFFVKNTSYGGSYVAYIDYAVLMPKTAKVLTYGRIEPGQANMGNTGTVLQIPTSRSTTQLSQLKQGAREIANILKRGGWFD